MSIAVLFFDMRFFHVEGICAQQDSLFAADVGLVQMFEEPRNDMVPGMSRETMFVYNVKYIVYI